MFTSFTAQAHDYHISLAEMNWNSKTSRFEVALKVFTDDLELALSDMSGKKTVLKTAENLDPLISDYLKKHFWVSTKSNEKLSGKFIGYEQDADVTWLYFEIPVTAVPSRFTLHNSILTDQYSDQMNIVNLKFKGKVHSHIFKKDEVLNVFEI